MTKAHALKKYYKKMYDIDLEGMSVTAVLKDMFKKKYEMDVDGNSFTSVLLNAAYYDDSGNESLPSSPSGPKEYNGPTSPDPIDTNEA